MPNFLDALKAKLAAAVAMNGHTDEPQRARIAAERVEPAPEPPEPQTPPPISREELWRRCDAIVTLPRILDRFAEDFRLSGVVGEDRTAKLIYLAVTSRWFERPTSIAVKGPSSGGKSYTVKKVLDFFPGDAYYALTAMSERALAYSSEPLKHRFVVLYEAAGMKGEVASYLVRSLLSEGCLRYETVEKTRKGVGAKLIEREGPTGLITTTTLVGLHPENETRLLSVMVKDSPEQTAEIFVAIAEERITTIDLAPWQALQEWLVGGERRVSIPYGQQLARAIPPLAVRLRRDFSTLITLIKAHAFLHQASRERDDQGRIVATIEDYIVVRELVADLISDGVNASVSRTIRETVQAVAALQAVTPGGISLTQLVKALNLDKSSVSRRVRDAQDKGYLVNLEDGKGKPARLTIGERLPEDVEVLPPLENLECCTVA